jgi:hypothetical protein
MLEALQCLGCPEAAPAWTPHRIFTKRRSPQSSWHKDEIKVVAQKLDQVAGLGSCLCNGHACPMQSHLSNGDCVQDTKDVVRQRRAWHVRSCFSDLD